MMPAEEEDHSMTNLVAATLASLVVLALISPPAFAQGRVAGGGRLHLDSSRFGRVADRQLIRVIGGLKPCDKGRLGRLSESAGRNVSEA